MKMGTLYALLLAALCHVGISNARLVTPDPAVSTSFFTSLLLAPITFASFCYSAFVSVKRDKKARDLICSRHEIDAYSITITAFTSNKRTVLRSKLRYSATLTGLNYKKVTSACIKSIRKQSPDRIIIVKPSITTDTEVSYDLLAFTTRSTECEKLQADLLDVFFIPEDETLTKTKKVAVGVAPIGLIGLVLLLALI